jgi:hypothetical protein
MNKLLILLPCYNDWNNLNILIPKINKVLKGLLIDYKIIIINDASKIKLKLNFSNFKIGNNYILNIKKNVGSQIAIFTALSYLSKNNILSDIIILDSDGEDNPNFIKKLLLFANENKGSIIKINRIFRSDHLIFKIFYELYLILTFIITLKYIRFGNFSFIPKKYIKIIPKYKRDFCYAYSSAILKNFTNIKTLFTNRDKRYLGRSKMSLVNLFFHALRVITVFRYRVFLIFILYLFIIYYFYSLTFYFFIFLLITLFVFSSIIFTMLKINFLSNKNSYLNISNFKKLY